jgi:putative hydrolase of the HAD superfamily
VTGMTDGLTAVVFDFYGTLTPVSPADTWAEHTSQLAAVLRISPDDLLRALDDSYPERFTGALGGVRQTLQTLAGRIGAHPSDEQLDEAARLRQAIQETLLKLRPEAVPVIEELRARGLRIGLVSDCTAELPAAWPRLPVESLVDAPVFSFVEGTRKPDPRLFHAAADRLGVDPAACLALEDSHNGVRAAHAAGMMTVMVPDLLEPTDEMRAKCHAIAESLHHVRDLIDGVAAPLEASRL